MSNGLICLILFEKYFNFFFSLLKPIPIRNSFCITDWNKCNTVIFKCIEITPNIV